MSKQGGGPCVPEDAVDQRAISNRLDFIKSKIRPLMVLAEEDQVDIFLADGMNLDAAIRRLQVSIESMVDIAYHLCAKKLSRAPENAAHAFELLANNSIIPTGFLAKALIMIRFRNKVVHGYLDENIDAVAAILKTDLADFAQWEKIVTTIMSNEKATQPGE